MNLINLKNNYKSLDTFVFEDQSNIQEQIKISSSKINENMFF